MERERRTGGGLPERVMRAALRLYPASFRRELGADMLEAFRRERFRRRGHGRLRSVGWLLSTALATAWGGVRERLHGVRLGRRRGRHEGGPLGAGTMGRRMEGGPMRTEELRQNLTLFARQSRRQPGFAALMVATLALGIGATAGVFSVVRGVLLQPLPYPDPDRLVYLNSGGAASLLNLHDLGDRLESLELVEGIFVPNTVNLTGEGEAAQLQRSWVSADFFRVVGLQPALGRWLEAEDMGTHRMVLSYGDWQTRFGSDPGVVGRTLHLDEIPHEVVGVAPPAMGIPFAVDVWTSLPFGPGEGARGIRGWRAVEPYARLADGWSLEAAREEIASEWARLQAEYPDANEGWEVGIQTVKSQVTADDATPLKLLFGAAGLFLLVACTNVASLFLSRLDGRRREFAVRSSLGAARGRLLRQVWTEMLGLALLGGVAGVALAALGVEWGVARFGTELSRPDQVVLDGGVLLFALLAALFTAAFVGGVTVLAWGAEEPARALKRVGRAVAGRYDLLRRSMVVAQVAMALTMVVGIGLLVRSFQKMQAIDVGVTTESVIVGSVGTFSSSRYPDADSRRALLDRIQERVGAIPGVEGVAMASYLPLGGCCSNRLFHSVADPDAESGAEVRRVTPSYFRVLGIPLLAGEEMASLDADEPTGVLVSNVMTSQLFGSIDEAIGAEVQPNGGENAYRIHGVVGPVREWAPTREAPPVLYFSDRQVPLSGGYLVVRSSLGPSRLAPALREALGEVDPSIPLDEVRPLDDVLAGYLADHRATTFLMTLLGALALGLGSVGIYGVMSHAVQGRQREFGVRLALGASRERVASGILSGALALVGPGLLLGLAGAWAARRFVESLLYEVTLYDPWVIGGVMVLFTGAALAATLGPARRASRVDVVEILNEG